MQGLYPPFMLNEISGVAFDKANLLANGSYLDYPLSGYRKKLLGCINPKLRADQDL
jgi:hypothetical protein